MSKLHDIPKITFLTLWFFPSKITSGAFEESAFKYCEIMLNVCNYCGLTFYTIVVKMPKLVYFPWTCQRPPRFEKLG